MQSAYFFVTLFLILFYSPGDISSNKELCISRFLSLVLFLSLFFGLRNLQIGGDSVVYVRMFQHPETYSAKLEPFFLALLAGLRTLSLDGNYLLFSLSFLLLFFQLYAYYKINGQNFFIYFILYSSFYYYYQFHMNIMRQGLAILLVAMSYLAYRKKKIAAYIAWGLLGISIHVTALVFLLYPLFSIKITRKKQVVFLGLIFLMFFTHFASFIINAIPDFHWAITKIKWYFTIAEPVHIKQSHLVSLCIIFFFTLHFNEMQKSPYFSLFTFHTLFFTFLGLFHECVLVYDRFYFYLQIFEPVLIYEFRCLFKEKQAFKHICLFGSICMSFITVFIWGPRNFLAPYTFQFLR